MHLLVSSQFDWCTITRSTLNTPVHGSKQGDRVRASLALVEIDLGMGDTVTWRPAPLTGYYAFEFFDPVTGVTVGIPHEGDEVQGLRIVAPGSAVVLKTVKAVRSMLMKGWRPTRLDFCWNIQEIEFDIFKMYAAWREYSPKFGVLKPDMVGDPVKGETFYIGARASDFHVRIYDKAKEKGMHGRLFLRVEAEVKGDLVKAVMEHDFDQVDAYAAEVSRKAGFVREMFPVWKVFQEISTEVSQTGEIVVPRKESKRAAWFRDQVTASFGKLSESEPDVAREIIDKFTAILGDR